MSLESHRVNYYCVLTELHQVLYILHRHKMKGRHKENVVYDEKEIKITRSDDICQICKKEKSVLNIVEDYFLDKNLLSFCVECIASLYTTTKILSNMKRAINKVNKRLEEYEGHFEEKWNMYAPRLYPIVIAKYPDLGHASNIIRMLVRTENISYLLESPDYLHETIDSKHRWLVEQEKKTRNEINYHNFKKLSLNKK
jgi:hypothetical protein